MNKLSTAISLVALVFSVASVWYALAVAKWVAKNNKTSTQLRQLTEIQTELTEHADSIGAINKSLAKLRSRIGMRKLREADKGSDEPDSATDPAGWKAWKREQLFGRSKK